MKRMGLETQFREKAVMEQGTALVDRYGRRKAYFAANRSGEGLQSFTTDYEISRGDLVQLLYDALTGMGTSSAMIGAYFLAGELGKIPAGQESAAAIGEALAAYHRIFSPFMVQVQRDVAENGSSWMNWLPTSWWGIGVLNFCIGLAAWLKLDVIARWLLREDTGDWKLPDYKRMDLRVE